MYPTGVILLMELSNHYAHRALSVNDMPTLPLPCSAGSARACAALRTPVIEVSAPCDCAGDTLHVRLSDATSSSVTVVEPEKSGQPSGEGKHGNLDALCAA